MLAERSRRVLPAQAADEDHHQRAEQKAQPVKRGNTIENKVEH